MKLKLTYIFTFIVVFCLNLKANEPLLDSAKSNYDKGNFEAAIQYYESILSKGLTSSNLHHNLGDAYFRNGEIGLSILNFEKAIKIDASNEDAKFNLELANTKIIDKFDQVPEISFTSFLRGVNLVFSYESISIIGIILLISSASLFTFGKKENKKQFIKTARLSALIGIILTFWGWKQKSAIDNYRAGTLIVQSSNVFSEPNPSSTLLFEIHEGTKLEIIDESNDWINVKTPNNTFGWIEKSTLSEI